MKALLQILAPLVTALIGYVASGAFRPAEEKSHAKPAPTDSTQTASSSDLPEDPRFDPVGSVIARFAGEPSLAGLASTLEAIERLTPAQVGELLQRTITMRLPSGVSESDRIGRVGMLMRAWAERDPQAATEWMRPRLERYARMPGFGSGYVSAETELVDIWAHIAPKQALEIARSYPRSELGYKLLSTVISTSPDRDRARRFELLRDFPAGSVRQRMVRQFCEGWARTDFPAALAAIGSMAADADRTEALRTMLPNSVGSDPAGTLAQAEALGMADDPKTVLRLAIAAGDKAPWVTTRWLESLGPEQLRSAGPALVLAWAKKEPATAFGWALKHGFDISAAVLAGADTETRNWASSRFDRDTPMQVAMQSKPEVVLAWLHKQPAGSARDTAVVQTLRAMHDPQQMIPLLAMLPPETAPKGAEAIAASFFFVSLDGAKEWAGSLPAGPTRTAAWTGLGKGFGAAILPQLPPGPDRDALLHGTTQASYFVLGFPEKAMDRVLAIDDPKLRRQTFDDVMGSWARNPKQRESAAPWLDRAAIPEEWKAHWRGELK